MSEDPDPSRPDSGLPDAPRIEVQIAVEDPVWHERLPELTGLIERVSRAALCHLEVRHAWGGSSELSVLLSDDRCAGELNRAYRSRDGATNVLSFAYHGDGCPASGPDVCLGDIVLARETIEREAAGQDKALSDHLSHLLVHGVLHLCGFDHQTDVEAGEMERLEREVLATLGIEDPYRLMPAAGPVA